MCMNVLSEKQLTSDLWCGRHSCSKLSAVLGKMLEDAELSADNRYETYIIYTEHIRKDTHCLHHMQIYTYTTEASAGNRFL